MSALGRLCDYLPRQPQNETLRSLREVASSERLGHVAALSRDELGSIASWIEPRGKWHWRLTHAGRAELARLEEADVWGDVGLPKGEARMETVYLVSVDGREPVRFTSAKAATVFRAAQNYVGHRTDLVTVEVPRRIATAWGLS